MAKSGELKEIWDVAARTNLQFNMVGFALFSHLLLTSSPHTEGCSVAFFSEADPLSYQGLNGLYAGRLPS